MSRIKMAFRFIYKSYDLVKGQTSFQKLLIRYAVVGLILLALWFIPMALMVGLIGLTTWGLILLGLVTLFLLITLLVWGRITMLQALSIFDGQMQPDSAVSQQENQKTWLPSQSGDAALFAFLLPGLRIRKFSSSFSKTTIESQDHWLRSAYLIWPLMAIESLSLDQAIDRLKTIMHEKLIRFQPALIPVVPVVLFFQWLFIVLGGWIGFVVGMNIADPSETAGIIPILGTLIAVLISGIFTLIGIHINTFSRACYYGALYRWVKNVQIANSTGISEKATPPAILGQVLAKSSINKKER